jgi:hypothetical protein
VQKAGADTIFALRERTMKPIGKFVILACVALVAGVTFLVYVNHDKAMAPSAARPSKRILAQTAGNMQTVPKQPSAGGSSTAAEAPSPPPPTPLQEQAANSALYDVSSLPKPVQAMLGRIINAAQSGSLDAVLTAMQLHEIPPLLTNKVTPDPLAYIRAHSVDGTGHDFLAAMLNVFASGFAKKSDGRQTTYIWPYFATRDLTRLTPDEQVDLYRIVPAKQAAAMLKSGKYTYYRAGISADGVWHYFLR